jgi:hypothetical protein
MLYLSRLTHFFRQRWNGRVDETLEDPLMGQQTSTMRGYLDLFVSATSFLNNNLE